MAQRPIVWLLNRPPTPRHPRGKAGAKWSKGYRLNPIVAGQSGPEVEDVQSRLALLGYAVTSEESEAAQFGPTTLAAVRTFRQAAGLPAGDAVDEKAWIALVDATYRLGDRTLYLRLPYFHGADVSHLQMTLNVLGFSCGEVDGYYGPHTEAAVREFQANSGLFPDGMAFQDTFDAIERLHHVWMGKDASTTFSDARFGLSRAVDVLENSKIVACGTDPISRNVVGRMWNVALATTNAAGFTLVDEIDGTRVRPSDYDVSLIVSAEPLSNLSDLQPGWLYVSADSIDQLAGRVMSALRSTDSPHRMLRVELPHMNSYDGSVTAHDVQSAAITLLDAICDSLSQEEFLR